MVNLTCGGSKGYLKAEKGIVISCFFHISKNYMTSWHSAIYPSDLSFHFGPVIGKHKAMIACEIPKILYIISNIIYLPIRNS